MPNATHDDIGTDQTISWGPLEWEYLIFKPLATTKIDHELGLMLRFIVFIPHIMAAGVTLPQNTKRILDDIGIGSTYQDVLTFVFRDLRNAFCDTNYSPTEDIEQIITDKTRNRTRLALQASCQFNHLNPTVCKPITQTNGYT
jgi:hypothetical protein